MKKFLALLFAGAMVLTLTACSNNNTSSSGSSDNTSQSDAAQSTDNSSAADSNTDSNTDSESTPDAESEPTDGETAEGGTIELLNNVWNTFGEGEAFAVIGGDFNEENTVDGAAGKYSIDDADAIDNGLGFPASEISKIEEAASLTHMMNANTFTCGAYLVKDSSDIDGLCESLSENILARQWMCGFPDKMVIINEGKYVVCMFGAEEPVNNFRDKMLNVYPTATVVSDTPILD